MRSIAVAIILISTFACKGRGSKSSGPDPDNSEIPNLGIIADPSDGDLELAKCMKISRTDPTTPVNGYELVSRFESCGGANVEQFQRVVQKFTTMMPESPTFVPSSSVLD